MKTDEYLKHAAASIERQAQEHLGIPVDPDLADFMGAFEETAVSLEDFDPLTEGEAI
jgi:hypothetical protein